MLSSHWEQSTLGEYAGVKFPSEGFGDSGNSHLSLDFGEEMETDGNDSPSQDFDKGISGSRTTQLRTNVDSLA